MVLQLRNFLKIQAFSLVLTQVRSVWIFTPTLHTPYLSELEKISSWFQTGELEKSSSDR